MGPETDGKVTLRAKAVLSYLRGGAIGFEPVCLSEIFDDSQSELTQTLNCLRRVSQTGSGLGWIYQSREMNQGALMHGLHSYRKGHIIFAYLGESIHSSMAPEC